MFKPITGPSDFRGARLAIRDAEFPTPFAAGLEFNAPARGPWNIVHTGMLLPEAHQIYVCAQGCLRGVILTAAEMNAMDRMSWVSVTENDLFNGQMDRNIVEGTAAILRRMKKLPPVVLLFISCIHLFAGCDFEAMISELRELFPEVTFVDCYMNPTMRKSGLTPDQLIRRQLYRPLPGGEADPRSVNLIGNDRPTDESSELVTMIRQSGFALKDITACRNYAEYRRMGASFLNITYLPTARAAGDDLAERLGRRHLYLPFSYGYGEMETNLRRLAETLETASPDFSALEEDADAALKKARDVIGSLPIEIDYTATPRPLGLARLLAEHDFHVRGVEADVFIDEERDDFFWLQKNLPELRLSATVHAKMRFAGRGVRETEKVLAIGQKAAYFCGTGHFVNIVSGGGMFGFDGVRRLADRMIVATLHEEDTERVIQYKGLGCASCL